MKKKLFFVVGAPFSGRHTCINQVKSILKDRVDVFYTNLMFQKTGKVEEADHYYEDARFVLSLVKQALSKSTANNVIVYGFPRNIEQVKFVVNPGTFPEYYKMIINFEIPMSESMEQSSERVMCPNCKTSFYENKEGRMPKIRGMCDECGSKLITRNNERVAYLARRWKLYHDETVPAIQYMKMMGLPFIERRYGDELNYMLTNFN